MMIKEKNYNEFVNECICKGREEKQIGLGFTLEQAKASSKQVIKKTKVTPFPPNESHNPN
ncbi:hypothetical protein [Lonepinella sp. BR2357]|uniref:hypothetical protein n=1 Tax=Lonepinella sp. BR2357 TaxID=3434549 RepID=UPI003F6DCA15